MAKVSNNSNLGAIKNPSDFSKQASALLLEMTKMINGNLEFSENMKCQLVSVSFPVADQEVAVSHQLNKSDVSYFSVKNNVACNVYAGNTPNTKQVVYLKSNQISQVRLVLF